jgi:hypothetical protein
LNASPPDLERLVRTLDRRLFLDAGYTKGQADVWVARCARFEVDPAVVALRLTAAGFPRATKRRAPRGARAKDVKTSEGDIMKDVKTSEATA